MTYAEFLATRRETANVGAVLLGMRNLVDLKSGERDQIEPLIGCAGLLYGGFNGPLYWIVDTGGDECRYRSIIGREEHETSDLSFLEAELHSQVAVRGIPQQGDSKS